MKPTDESPASNSQKTEPLSLKQLMLEYHKSHQNHTNQLIHYLCVPLIFWSISAIFWLVKLPLIGNLTILALAFLMLYYALKSVKVMLIMLVFSGLCIAINMAFETLGWPLFITAISVFIVTWIGQFFGHYIEGQRPSFLKDLQFLLIGPAWVAYKILGIKP